MGEDLISSFRAVVTRVDACAKAAPVTVIAVSKLRTAFEVEAVLKQGCRDFGENYVQELVKKAKALGSRPGGDAIRWHFIGGLQTNKVKALIPFVHCIHSVGSEKLGAEIAKRWRESGREGKIPIFVQVNQDEEASKTGVSPADTLSLVQKLSRFAELEILGLMSIPAPASQKSASEVEKSFKELRELEKTCRPATGGKLSMGMSDDFEEAIRQGSTHVRIGTAIFGKRPD